MAGTLLKPRQRRESTLYVPREWSARARRDVALDLLRGLAMVILVINHTALESPLRDATRAVLSAAEVLVMVSGVVVGMVFGRRWLEHGARATTRLLVLRARKLYVASVVVVGLVGLALLVPFLGAEALAISPRVGVDTYAYDSAWRTALSIVTLEAGPWQFNILGFFITVLLAAPLVLAALARGWWPVVLGTSVALYLAGRTTGVDVLPAQSERAFPLLVWQLLFVGGMVLGWQRDAVAAWVHPRRKLVWGVIGATAVTLTVLRLALPRDVAIFHKGSLAPLRILLMASVAAAIYGVLRHHEAAAERRLGPVLLPLGRNSFYVFIVHVFACLALASVPFLAPGEALGPIGNVLVQIAVVAAMVVLVRRRVLFRWIPR
jgi:hypothetical protein